MIEFISATLSECLFGNGLITANERDEYRYYIQLLVEKVIGFTPVLLIAIGNHLLLQTIFMLLFFSNVRKFSGGFHAGSFIECLCLSIVIYLGYVKFIFVYMQHRILLNICLLAGALIIILAIGAVNHPDMHWSETEYVMCKGTARMMCIIEVAVIITFWLLGGADSYILFMSFGVILSAIMLLLAKLVKQEVTV